MVCVRIDHLRDTKTHGKSRIPGNRNSSSSGIYFKNMHLNIVFDNFMLLACYIMSFFSIVANRRAEPDRQLIHHLHQLWNHLVVSMPIRKACLFKCVLVQSEMHCLMKSRICTSCPTFMCAKWRLTRYSNPFFYFHLFSILQI